MLRVILFTVVASFFSFSLHAGENIKNLYHIVIDRSHSVRSSDKEEYARYEKAFLNYAFSQVKRSRSSYFFIVGARKGENLIYSNTRVLNTPQLPPDHEDYAKYLQSRRAELDETLDKLDVYDRSSDKDYSFKTPVNLRAVFKRIKLNEQSFDSISGKSRVFILSPFFTTTDTGLTNATLEEIIDVNIDGAFKQSVILLPDEYKDQRTTEVFWAEDSIVPVAKKLWESADNGFLRIENVIRTKNSLSTYLPPESQ